MTSKEESFGTKVMNASVNKQAVIGQDIDKSDSPYITSKKNIDIKGQQHGPLKLDYNKPSIDNAILIKKQLEGKPISITDEHHSSKQKPSDAHHTYPNAPHIANASSESKKFVGGIAPYSYPMDPQIKDNVGIPFQPKGVAPSAYNYDQKSSRQNHLERLDVDPRARMVGGINQYSSPFDAQLQDNSVDPTTQSKALSANKYIYNDNISSNNVRSSHSVAQSVKQSMDHAGKALSEAKNAIQTSVDNLKSSVPSINEASQVIIQSKKEVEDIVGNAKDATSRMLKDGSRILQDSSKIVQQGAQQIGQVVQDTGGRLHDFAQKEVTNKFPSGFSGAAAGSQLSPPRTDDLSHRIYQQQRQGQDENEQDPRRGQVPQSQERRQETQQQLQQQQQDNRQEWQDNQRQDRRNQQHTSYGSLGVGYEGFDDSYREKRQDQDYGSGSNFFMKDKLQKRLEAESDTFGEDFSDNTFRRANISSNSESQWRTSQPGSSTLKSNEFNQSSHNQQPPIYRRSSDQEANFPSPDGEEYDDLWASWSSSPGKIGGKHKDKEEGFMSTIATKVSDYLHASAHPQTSPSQSPNVKDTDAKLQNMNVVMHDYSIGDHSLPPPAELSAQMKSKGSRMWEGIKDEMSNAINQGSHIISDEQKYSDEGKLLNSQQKATKLRDQNAYSQSHSPYYSQPDAKSRLEGLDSQFLTERAIQAKIDSRDSHDKPLPQYVEHSILGPSYKPAAFPEDNRQFREMNGDWQERRYGFDSGRRNFDEVGQSSRLLSGQGNYGSAYDDRSYLPRENSYHNQQQQWQNFNSEDTESKSKNSKGVVARDGDHSSNEYRNSHQQQPAASYQNANEVAWRSPDHSDKYYGSYSVPVHELSPHGYPPHHSQHNHDNDIPTFTQRVGALLKNAVDTVFPNNPNAHLPLKSDFGREKNDATRNDNNFYSDRSSNYPVDYHFQEPIMNQTRPLDTDLTGLPRFDHHNYSINRPSYGAQLQKDTTNRQQEQERLYEQQMHKFQSEQDHSKKAGMFGGDGLVGSFFTKHPHSEKAKFDVNFPSTNSYYYDSAKNLNAQNNPSYTLSNGGDYSTVNPMAASAGSNNYTHPADASDQMKNAHIANFTPTAPPTEGVYKPTSEYMAIHKPYHAAHPHVPVTHLRDDGRPYLHESGTETVVDGGAPKGREVTAHGAFKSNTFRGPDVIKDNEVVHGLKQEEMTTIVGM